MLYASIISLFYHKNHDKIKRWNVFTYGSSALATVKIDIEND